MSKTIKSPLSIVLQKVKIVMLKSKIMRMQSCTYLDLSERIELREAVKLLSTLEPHKEVYNSPLLSLQ